MMRDYLSELINWSSIGFELVGTAMDGRNAIEFITANPVDVVLSDIRMPVMDGLLLAEFLKNQYSHIIIILMTAHREFEYAREAIKLGISDYLLKSDEEDVIRKCFMDLRKKLDTNKNTVAEIANDISVEKTDTMHPCIAKCLTIINKNLGNISLSELAWHTHLHEKYLSRLFKSELGRTFSSIQAEKTIEAAKLYLMKSELKIYEISELLGFGTAAYFSEIFKKHVGKSPIEFRKTVE
jgi:YesN/AraC family two-component response regulator